MVTEFLILEWGFQEMGLEPAQRYENIEMSQVERQNAFLRYEVSWKAKCISTSLIITYTVSWKYWAYPWVLWLKTKHRADLSNASSTALQRNSPFPGQSISSISRNAWENSSQQRLKIWAPIMFLCGSSSPVSMHWSIFAVNTTNMSGYKIMTVQRVGDENEVYHSLHIHRQLLNSFWGVAVWLKCWSGLLNI